MFSKSKYRAGQGNGINDTFIIFISYLDINIKSQVDTTQLQKTNKVKKMLGHFAERYFIDSNHI